jgi:hypothetical protein
MHGNSGGISESKRQLLKDLLIEVSYDGSYSDRMSLSRTMSPIPA